MEDDVMFISDVTPGIADWSVKVTITEEMSILTRREKGTRYKCYVFTDDQGGTIIAIVYTHDITLFSNALNLHGVYYISNASVRVPRGTQNTHGYSVHWVLQRGTIVRNLPDEEPTLRYFLDGLTPLNMLGEKLKEDNPIADIMAIVIKAGPIMPTNIGGRDGKVQHFTLSDSGVWDKQLENKGPKLEEAVLNHSVVVIKRLNIRNYRGPTLTATNVSSFIIDPPIQEAMDLEAWVAANREMDLSGLLANYSITNSRDLVMRNLVRKYSVGQIQSNEKCGDFWTRSFLQIPSGEQLLFYIGCCNCYTKAQGFDGCI